jgi:chemotaxis protein CheD
MVELAQRQPPATFGMEKINRYWDRSVGVWAAKILPGELYVSSHGEMVVTVLGSCVAACIRDRVRGVGGMNHFMLPEANSSSNHWADALETRYGNWAMEYLINEILKLGGMKRDLEVKLFGGGQILENMTDVGGRNVAFVREYLAREEIPIAAEDLGGVRPRKVLYFSDTGNCRVRRLNQVTNDTIYTREKAYAKKVATTDTDGSVELF